MNTDKLNNHSESGGGRWHCLLARTDVPELFRAAFRSARLPGQDAVDFCRWRLFDESGHLLYEVADVQGVVAADAPGVVQALFRHALMQFPEAFGIRGDQSWMNVYSPAGETVHKKCA